jgi:hypothetical protein
MMAPSSLPVPAAAISKNDYPPPLPGGSVQNRSKKFIELQREKTGITTTTAPKNSLLSHVQSTTQLCNLGGGPCRVFVSVGSYHYEQHESVLLGDPSSATAARFIATQQQQQYSPQ